MYLARRVHVSQEHSRQDRDRIFQVVDVRDVQVGINIICKRLVSNARKTIQDGLERRSGGEVEWEVHRVKKRERSTCAHRAVTKTPIMNRGLSSIGSTHRGSDRPTLQSSFHTWTWPFGQKKECLKPSCRGKAERSNLIHKTPHRDLLGLVILETAVHLNIGRKPGEERRI